MSLRIKKKNVIFEQRVKSQMPVPKEVKQIYNLFKKNGFKWAPSKNAWQRQLTTNALNSLTQILETLKGENE